MQFTIHYINAFTREKDGGNPAGVIVLAADTDTDTLLRIAKKEQLPVISYLRPIEGGFDLRWFTTESKLSLCGHGTLAAAHCLWESGTLAPTDSARFHTQAGWLSVNKLEDGFMEMDFPAHGYSPATLPERLVEAFGAGSGPLRVFMSEGRYLVELPDEDQVRQFQFKEGSLGQHKVIITARANPGADYAFVSRFFHPTAGNPEDFVTGSTHCVLTPYWGERLGKTEMSAYQVSPRGGFLKLRWTGDRVLIAGEALRTGKGLVDVPTQ
jgi:PhzF family phenazine biosynthesis protein